MNQPCTADSAPSGSENLTDTLDYMSGFGNQFSSEAIQGALPASQNSPQRCPFGLYAEQISGTAFTAPRETNRRSWCYRIRPSVQHLGQMHAINVPLWRSAPAHDDHGLALGQYRWNPVEVPDTPVNFVSGMRTITTAGDALSLNGMASHVYLISQDMNDDYFYTADSELLIVPQLGSVEFATEFGRIQVSPGQVVVIPRGIVFAAKRLDTQSARGFVCENYSSAFELPNLGAIGSNGLANARDFQTPVAAFEDKTKPCTVTVKWCGKFHQTTIDHSPLDVVAWHGNHAPYRYDLQQFSPIGSIGVDHPDPSIFTVLTSASEVPGTANVDFVIFPERWLVAENTFRPPWYHKNIMSEFMGNIYGVYDAKPGGFVPGGMSLHNMMMPHGPDHEAFEQASNAALSPHKLINTLSFMFETRLPQQLTHYAANDAPLQKNYKDCWKQLKRADIPTS